MNGFADHGLDESVFGEKKGFSDGLRTFDAFRESSVPQLCLLNKRFSDGLFGPVALH